jgi:hypothetical protein
LQPSPNAPPAPVAIDRKTGGYVSPAAANLAIPRNMPGNLVLHGPGAEPVPVPPAIVGYRCGPDTWSRNMEGYEVARLVDMAMRTPGEAGDGLTMEITIEEYAKLPGDLRRHFMAVRR